MSKLGISKNVVGSAIAHTTRASYCGRDHKEHWLGKLLGYIVVLGTGLWGVWLMVHDLAGG